MLKKFFKIFSLTVLAVFLLAYSTIQAQDPEKIIRAASVDSTYYAAFSCNRWISYSERREDAWQNYINDEGEKGDSGIVGQQAVVDLTTASGALYLFGYEYTKRYYLGIDITKYRARLDIHFVRVNAKWAWPWPAEYRPQSFRIVAEGVGSVEVGETEESGSATIPLSLDSNQIDIKYITDTYRKKNPIPEVCPEGNVRYFYDERVGLNTRILLYPLEEGERPTANILSIKPNPATSNRDVSFQGSGTDSNGTIVAYSWRSSIEDKQLSKQASFTTSSLSVGTHTISFKVKDNDSLWSDEVTKELTISPQDTTSNKNQGKHPQDDLNDAAEPVNIVTGNMYTTTQDLFIPSRGIPFDFNRTYNSHKNYVGPIGYGWTHSYNILLEDLETEVKIMMGDGRGIYFTKETDNTFTAPAGEHSTLTKDGSAFIWELKQGIVYRFNEAGKLLSIKDRNNNQITLEYNGDNLLEKVYDTAGREITFSYNTDNRLTEITDFAGRGVIYAYDNEGNLTSVTDPRGKTTAYEYNADHNITKVTDPNSDSLYYEYDNEDRCVLNYYDNDTLKVGLAYDPDNKKTTITDSIGNQTIRTYNDDGLVIQEQDCQGTSTYYTWDTDYNRTSAKDKNENLTQMAYDEKGNLTSVTDPEGNISNYEYESQYSFISKQIDALGNETTYTYDEKGNLTQITNALGDTTSYQYDDYGQVTSVTDVRGNTTTSEYDAQGNLISINDALNNTTSYGYDARGNQTSIIDAKGNTTNYTYDAGNNVTKATYSDATFFQISYDAAGNRSSVTDPNNNTTTFEYTITKKLTKTTDALSRVTQYEYDTEENLIKVTDPAGNVTEYKYDALNRLIEEINPIGKTKTFTYDKAGNKTSVTDSRGHTTNYEYDTLNRLTKIIYPDASSIEYTYDALGRKTSVTGKEGITQYIYDALGRIIEEDGPFDNDTITYEYDKVGNRVKMIDQDAGGTQYQYDKLNRLISLTDPQDKTTSYTYDETSSLTNTIYPNGIKTDYTFDNMSRVTSLINKTPSESIISSYEYSYDAAGRRTKAVLADGEITYSYDNANQLTGENKTGSHSAYAISYNYDVAGNRTQMIKDDVTHNYTYNAFNQLITQTNSNYSGGNKVTVQGEASDANIDKVYVNNVEASIAEGLFTAKVPLIAGENTITAQVYDKAGNVSTRDLQLTLDDTAETTYTYDNNGNQIQKSYRGEQTLYEYDDDNMLTNVLYPDNSSTEYTYDSLGRRLNTNHQQLNTNYHYDGNTVIIERGQEGNTTAAYTRGLSLGGGIGSIISKKEGENLYYYLYDGQGNVTHLTDEDGTVIMNYEYDAFGNIVYESGSLENSYQYQTKEYNEQSGLVFFGARYYDPSIGRFTTPDPLGMVDGPNRYVYLNSNPIGFIDPWGLCGSKSGGGGSWEVENKPYWPKWIEIFIPGYENYGGPIRTDPTFRIEPSDSMDSLFREHDIFWAKGRGRAADQKLLRELYRLPSDSRKWEKPAKNPMRANFYRQTIVEPYFWWVNKVRSK